MPQGKKKALGTKPDYKQSGLEALFGGSAAEDNPDSQTIRQPANPKKKVPYKEDPDYKMVTFYIKKPLLAKLHALTIEQEKELTELANEAIEDLLNKHNVQNR